MRALSLIPIILLILSSVTAFSPSDYFVSLDSNIADIDHGTAIFTIKNPGADVLIIDSSKLLFNFKEVHNGIKNYKVDYLNNYVTSENQTVSYDKTNCTNVTSMNESISEVCNWQPVLAEVSVSHSDWLPVASLNVEPGQELKLRITGYFENIGSASIDWIPTVKDNTGWFGLWDDSYTNNEWAWWNTSYYSSKNLTITEVTNTSWSNYTALLNVTYAAGMDANFTDIRFINATNSSLYYWVQNFTSSVYANVWVDIPLISANGTVDLRMYYNSTGASNISDRTTVFKNALNETHGVDMTTSTATLNNPRGANITTKKPLILLSVQRDDATASIYFLISNTTTETYYNVTPFAGWDVLINPLSLQADKSYYMGGRGSGGVFKYSSGGLINTVQKTNINFTKGCYNEGTWTCNGDVGTFFGLLTDARATTEPTYSFSLAENYVVPSASSPNASEYNEYIVLDYSSAVDINQLSTIDVTITSGNDINWNWTFLSKGRAYSQSVSESSVGYVSEGGSFGASLIGPEPSNETSSCKAGQRPTPECPCPDGSGGADCPSDKPLTTIIITPPGGEVPQYTNISFPIQLKFSEAGDYPFYILATGTDSSNVTHYLRSDGGMISVGQLINEVNATTTSTASSWIGEDFWNTTFIVIMVVVIFAAFIGGVVMRG